MGSLTADLAVLQLAIGQSYSQLCQAYSRLCHPPITFNAFKDGLANPRAGWASLKVDYYLVTMKEFSIKKVLIVKKSLNDAL